MDGESLPSAAYAKVIRRAWSDPEFKARLIADPAAVLAGAGVPVPPGVKVRVVEDTAKLMHLVLPPHEETGELGDEALDLVVGGTGSIAQNVATAAML
jgi:hypothetical protein